MNRKTKVCTDCKKRKKIEEFFEQKGHNTKRHYSGDGRRRECKTCHGKKSRKALLLRTTPEQRSEYIRNYMRSYNRVRA